MDGWVGSEPYSDGLVPGFLARIISNFGGWILIRNLSAFPSFFLPYFSSTRRGGGGDGEEPGGGWGEKLVFED